MPRAADQAAAGTGIAAWITQREISVQWLAHPGPTVDARHTLDPNPQPRLVLARQSGPSSDRVFLKPASRQQEHECMQTRSYRHTCTNTCKQIQTYEDTHTNVYPHINQANTMNTCERSYIDSARRLLLWCLPTLLCQLLTFAGARASEHASSSGHGSILGSWGVEDWGASEPRITTPLSSA